MFNIILLFESNPLSSNSCKPGDIGRWGKKKNHHVRLFHWHKQQQNLCLAIYSTVFIRGESRKYSLNGSKISDATFSIEGLWNFYILKSSLLVEVLKETSEAYCVLPGILGYQLRPLKDCSSIWHQHFSSRTFKCCKLASHWYSRTYLSRTSYRHLIMWVEEWKCFSNQFWYYLAKKGHCCLEGVYLIWNNVQVGGTYSIKSTWMLPIVHPGAITERRYGSEWEVCSYTALYEASCDALCVLTPSYDSQH